MLVDLLREKMTKEGLSEREVARRVGVAPITVGRLLGGESVELEILEKMCNWLGVSLASALNARGVVDDKLAAQIALLVESEPELKNLFSNMLKDLSEESLSLNDVREIIRYATFRVSSRKASLDIQSRPVQGTS